MKVEIHCDMCGKIISRYPSQVKKHNFCGHQCLADFSSKTKNPEKYGELKDYNGISKHMSDLNAQMNPTRMNTERRTKLRNAHLGTGNGKAGYTKCFGKPAHRVAAEKKLGRKLQKEEVVHHMDFNGKNNAPWNLMIFKNNADHSRYHAQLSRFFETGETSCDVIEEVMPL